VAEYLTHFLQIDQEVLLTSKRHFFEDRYSRLLVNRTLDDFQQLQRDFETDFILWTFLQHLDLIRQILSRDFLHRHALAFLSLLPEKKNDRVFIRSLHTKEPRSLFNSRQENQFEDVKRLLKSPATQPLKEEEIFHFYNFFKLKLPVLFQEQRAAVLALLQGHAHPAFAVPAQAELIRDILQSDIFLAWLQQRSEKLEQEEYRQFLRDKLNKASPEVDQLVVLSLVSMDLFHEKSALFEAEHRQQLTERLNFVQGLVNYMNEAVFARESCLVALEQVVLSRTRTLYQLGAQLLQGIYAELQASYAQSQQRYQYLYALSQQTGKAITLVEGYSDWYYFQQHLQEINQSYTRHLSELTQAFHKRQETLEKLKAKTEGASSRHKVFFLKKLESCLRYIPRARQEQKTVQIQYQRCSEHALMTHQNSLFEQMSFDNDYEKLIAQRAFEKARNILVGLHHYKGTVKLNLRQLFGDELRKDTFWTLFQEALAELWDVASRGSDQTTEFLMQQLDVYLKGIGPKHPFEPCGFSARQRTGYIVAFLAQHEHLTLLADLKNHQLIYDWNQLFTLAHALMMLDSRRREPHLSFDQHFIQTLELAWDCLTHYCLFAGQGQFNQLANPLSLSDFSYDEAMEEYGGSPIARSLLAGADEETDFELLELPAPKPETRALPAGSVPATRALVPVREDQTDETESPESDYEQPARISRQALPSPGSRRLIPPAPSKAGVEIYTAPTRRVPNPVQNTPEEDNFYQLLASTYAGANPVARTPAPSAPASSHVEKTDTPNPPVDEPVAAEPRAIPTRSRRERWLELTPQPHQPESLDDIMDHILTRSQQPGSSSPRAASQSEPGREEDYNRLVEDILRRNRFDPNASVSSGETLSSHNQEELRRQGRKPPQV
jgi:hypothetical protein